MISSRCLIGLPKDAEKANAMVKQVFKNTNTLCERNEITREYISEIYKNYSKALREQNYELSIKTLKKLIDLYNTNKNSIEHFHKLYLSKSKVFGLISEAYIKLKDLNQAEKYCSMSLNEALKYVNIEQKQCSSEEKEFFKRWEREEAEERFYALVRFKQIYECKGEYDKLFSIINNVKNLVNDSSSNFAEDRLFKMAEKSYYKFMRGLSKRERKMMMRKNSKSLSANTQIKYN